MIVTYLRSSSVSAFNLCPHQYMLIYQLGVESKAGKAAACGNVCHKALETLAWASYHRARSNTSYVDETFGELVVKDITPEWATDASYDYYKTVEDHVKWDDRLDRPKCHEWVNTLLTSWGGLYDPRNMDVLQPEQKFDLVIDKPWAHYDYETPEGRFTGQLSIKGTMDLVTHDTHDKNYIEVIDYKSGRRKDWSISDEVESVKTFSHLMHDPQLLLYYYATRRLYPEAESVQFTIIFINDGGPFRLPFGPEHMEVAENMIRDNFERIRDMKNPILKKGPPCWTWCYFGKNSKKRTTDGRTVCETYAEQVRDKGGDKLFYEIGHMNKLMKYQDGGGRRATVET